MTAQGIKCMDTSAEKHHLELSYRIENSKFEIMYVIPQTLFNLTEDFFKIILWNHESTFPSKLIAITIDEYQVAKS